MDSSILIQTLVLGGLGLGIFFFISQYFSSSRNQTASEKGDDGILDPTQYKPFKLISKKLLTKGENVLPVYAFKFELPEGRSLNLPVGSHIWVQETIKGELVRRSYTPTTTNLDKGFFELVIKIYPSGAMGNHINSLSVGDYLPILGPKGPFRYKQGQYKHIGMIAGGTGITPMLQIIRHVFEEQDDHETKVTLLYGCLSVPDIILKDKIDGIKKENFKVYYVLNNPPKDWDQGSGFITADVIKSFFPTPANDNIVLICGPNPMVSAMTKNLSSLGYEKNNYFSF